MVLRTLCLLLLLAFSSGSIADTYILKFATLMPTGTAWSKILDDWVKDVEHKSDGRIKFKMYSGGVMGDEPDVLRKIRKGQLHGGMFTGYGIGRIYSPARVLEVPFLFKNVDETDYIREQIMPDLELGFRDSGFELLGWPEVGFIHFFSTKRITSVDDIKKAFIITPILYTIVPHDDSDVIGMICFPLPIETEEYIVGIEVAGRGEVLVGVPPDAFTQVEGIYRAIVGYAPGLGQAGNNLGGAGFELGQTVVDGLCGGIKVGTGRMQTRVKSPGATLGTVHLCLTGRKRGRCGHRQ